VPFWLAVVVLALLPRREPRVMDVRLVADNYRYISARLTAEAVEAEAKGLPIASRKRRYWAAIVEEAALSEERDTEPAGLGTRIVVPDHLVTAKPLCDAGKHTLRAAPGGSECVNCPYRVGEAK
jgi:hypothetical protein